MISSELVNETGITCSAATLERLAEIRRAISEPLRQAQQVIAKASEPLRQAQQVIAKAAAQSPYVKKQKAQKNYCEVNLDPGYLRLALLPNRPHNDTELSNAPAIDLLADCLASHAPPMSRTSLNKWQVPRE